MPKLERKGLVGNIYSVLCHLMVRLPIARSLRIPEHKVKLETVLINPSVEIAFVP